jgi:signal transduction histidine kinase
MVILVSIISHFYIQESIANIKSHEEHTLSCYANRITEKDQSIEEFKQQLFGTLESFTNKIAIIDENNKLLYTTFNKTPPYNFTKRTYFKENSVYYNNLKYFTDAGIVKVIFAKELDYSSVHKKIVIILVTIVMFLISSSLFLYFHIRDIYTNITKELDSFFKSAIHEIRTPLGVIQINLDFLENSNPDSMALKRAQGGVRNLTSVYESLEYCIKQKKVKYKKEKINFSRFLKYRIDFFKVLGEIKDVTMQSSIEENIFIYMSQVELQRLIDNNLSNAIKYSKEHTTISISLANNKTNIILSFSNSGNKIENINKIFRQYYRDDNVKGGFGLGLSIVKKICLTYNISIQATSDDEGLATFIYKIPDNLLTKSKE